MVCLWYLLASSQVSPRNNEGPGVASGNLTVLSSQTNVFAYRLTQAVLWQANSPATHYGKKMPRYLPTPPQIIAGEVRLREAMLMATSVLPYL